MATAPRPPQQQAGVNPMPPQQPHAANPAPAHEDKPHEDKPPEPERVVPVGEQQLKVSEEMEKVGLEKWIAEHDERKPADHGKAVEGSTPKAH